MMDFGYTVKVYADAVELGFRTLESIPDSYKKAVEHVLEKRKSEQNLPQNLPRHF